MEVWILTKDLCTWVFYVCKVYVRSDCLFWFNSILFVLFFLTEACADFFKAVFLLYFNWGFNQPVVHIGSLNQSHCKPGSLHGLTVVIFLWCVCVGGCVRVSSCMMDEAGWTLFSSVLSVLLQCGREWKTATCIHWYNILPPPPPPSVNQQAEWILMEPIYPASVLPLCSVNNPCCPRHCFNLTLCFFFPSFAWHQSLLLISEQFVFVFSCHFACTPLYL